MSFMKKLKYLFVLTRPDNVFIAFLTIWVAAIVSGGIDPVYNLTLAAFSAALITIGANLINDIFDIEIDRINKPDRPLPAGKVTVREAMVLFVCVYALAWVLAAVISMTMLSIAIGFGVLLILYSYIFKRMVLIGNLVVSISTAAAFIYAGMAVDRIEGTIFPAVFSFFYHFGREVIKDLQDVEGDAANGAVTFAIRYGTRASLMLISANFILLIILTLIPYITEQYGNIYLIIILSGIYPVVIWVVMRCWQSPVPATLGTMSNILKANMLVGLLAIYFG